MNYVPGTASLIDDIDSKLDRMVRCSLVDVDSLVKYMYNFKTCHRLSDTLVSV